MAYPLAKLRQITDEELIALHDNRAKTTDVDVNYCLNELNRRDQERASQLQQKLNEEMLAHTREMTAMTRTVTRATKIALAVSVLSLIVSAVALLK